MCECVSHGQSERQVCNSVRVGERARMSPALAIQTQKLDKENLEIPPSVERLLHASFKKSRFTLL